MKTISIKEQKILYCLGDDNCCYGYMDREDRDYFLKEHFCLPDLIFSAFNWMEFLKNPNYDNPTVSQEIILEIDNYLWKCYHEELEDRAIVKIVP
jgi:hypothetical protein